MQGWPVHGWGCAVVLGSALWIALFSSSLFAQRVEDPLVIVAAARKQLGVTVSYDPAYVVLSYPGGDVPEDRGVCTDVVVRALRGALGFDLQRAVHEDMKDHFKLYPKQWGLSRPDRNIDHRRVPNLQTFFSRYAEVLPHESGKPALYRAGDIVSCMLPGNLPHIMIVSDAVTAEGVPLVIHNIGGGAREEDALFSYRLTGHYRIKRGR